MAILIISDKVQPLRVADLYAANAKPSPMRTRYPLLRICPPSLRFAIFLYCKTYLFVLL